MVRTKSKFVSLNLTDSGCYYYQLSYFFSFAKVFIETIVHGAQVLSIVVRFNYNVVKNASSKACNDPIFLSSPMKKRPETVQTDFQEMRYE